MAPKEPDKVQREIEELLDKLDNFVPEDRFASKMKQRRREAAGPGIGRDEPVEESVPDRSLRVLG